MEAEKQLKHPTPASPTAEELEAAEAMWQESQPVRKFDPDRTDALYQDAQRRRESQASSDPTHTCAHNTSSNHSFAFKIHWISSDVLGRFGLLIRLDNANKCLLLSFVGFLPSSFLSSFLSCARLECVRQKTASSPRPSPRTFPRR